jgi:hypothetical protein
MTEEQELRAWSLSIVAILQKEKPGDWTKLVKSAALIGDYIKTGAMPPEKDIMALYRL